MAEKAAEFDTGGIKVVTEMGRWSEKKDATWMSGSLFSDVRKQ